MNVSFGSFDRFTRFARYRRLDCVINGSDHLSPISAQAIVNHRAWEVFGTKNACLDLLETEELIARFKQEWYSALSVDKLDDKDVSINILR